MAPRALVCIDTKTGKRFKVIPVEGAIEAVHAAGHYLAVAVAPLGGGGRMDGAAGSIVIVDFSKEGFGETTAQRAERKAAEAAAAAAVAAEKKAPKGRKTPAKAGGGAKKGAAGGVAKGGVQPKPKRRRRWTHETPWYIKIKHSFFLSILFYLPVLILFCSLLSSACCALSSSFCISDWVSQRQWENFYTYLSQEQCPSGLGSLTSSTQRSVAQMHRKGLEHKRER
jgi:hypothetical protein